MTTDVDLPDQRQRNEEIEREKGQEKNHGLIKKEKLKERDLYLYIERERKREGESEGEREGEREKHSMK